MPAWMTSELRELVSVPMASWRSMRTVEDEGRCCASCRAMARPTTPPPMTCFRVSKLGLKWSSLCIALFFI